MRVAYIACHRAGGNDDEGAIKHALESLGHSVTTVDERNQSNSHRLRADLALFHKWDDVTTLDKMKGKMLRAFWYFDLVDFSDPLLNSRNTTRMRWMEKVLPHIDMGFCTDGDWVGKVNQRPGTLFAPGQGKLRWLTQGADERYVRPGTPRPSPCGDILFTGISRHGGTGRESFVKEMERKYGDRFRHVVSGVHGRGLADLMASHKIVVAPDAPVTPNYWSNRVYNALGFGAFLMHPWCSRLVTQYEPATVSIGGVPPTGELVYYGSRDQLHERIAYFLDRPTERAHFAHEGYLKTKASHLYSHRVEQLMSYLKDVR